MPKHSAKQSTIKSKDPPQKQWDSLDPINQAVCYYYYIHFKSSNDPNSTETVGWKSEKSGCSDHFHWNTVIEKHFTSASSFSSRAKVKLAIVTQYDTPKRTCVPLFIVLYLIRRRNCLAFFHKKLCNLAEQLFKAGIPLREPLVEGVQLIADSQYSEARADSNRQDFPVEERNDEEDDSDEDSSDDSDDDSDSDEMIGDASKAGQANAREQPPKKSSSTKKTTSNAKSKGRNTKTDDFVLGDDEIEYTPTFKCTDVFTIKGYERVLYTVIAPADFTGKEGTFSILMKGKTMKTVFKGGLYALYNTGVYGDYLLSKGKAVFDDSSLVMADQKASKEFIYKSNANQYGQPKNRAWIAQLPFKGVAKNDTQQGNFMVCSKYEILGRSYMYIWIIVTNIDPVEELVAETANLTIDTFRCVDEIRRETLEQQAREKERKTRADNYTKWIQAGIMNVPSMSREQRNAIKHECGLDVAEVWKLSKNPPGTYNKSNTSNRNDGAAAAAVEKHQCEEDTAATAVQKKKQEKAEKEKQDKDAAAAADQKRKQDEGVTPDVAADCATAAKERHLLRLPISKIRTGTERRSNNAEEIRKLAREEKMSKIRAELLAELARQPQTKETHPVKKVDNVTEKKATQVRKAAPVKFKFLTGKRKTAKKAKRAAAAVAAQEKEAIRDRVSKYCQDNKIEIDQEQLLSFFNLFPDRDVTVLQAVLSLHKAGMGDSVGILLPDLMNAYPLGDEEKMMELISNFAAGGKADDDSGNLQQKIDDTFMENLEDLCRDLATFMKKVEIDINNLDEVAADDDASFHRRQSVLQTHQRDTDAAVAASELAESELLQRQKEYARQQHNDK